MSDLHRGMGDGDEPQLYEAQGESDHQIGVVPRERQKTASEVSEDESNDKMRRRCYSFGSPGGGGDSVFRMQLKELEEKVQELYSKNSYLKADLEASQDMCFNMLIEKDKTAAKTSQQLKVLQEKITRLEESLEESQTALVASETRRKMVEDRLMEVKRDNQQLSEEKDDCDKEIKSLSAEVEQCRKQLVQKDEEVQVIRENSASYIDAWIAKEKTGLERRISELVGTIKELKEENKNLMEEISSTRFDIYQQQTVPREQRPSSVSLISTESQTDHSSLDISEKSDSENESWKSEVADSTSSISSECDVESLPCLSTSTSTSSTPSSASGDELCRKHCQDLALLPCSDVVNYTPHQKLVTKAVECTLDLLRKALPAVYLLFKFFFLCIVFYLLLRYFKPFQGTLEISAIASQHGCLDHLEPPLI